MRGPRLGNGDPSGVTHCPHSVGHLCTDRLATFEDWAARNGVVLGGAFHAKEVHSTLTGKTYPERSFPMLTLAEWVGPDLRCVAPCREGDFAHSVEDCLDALRNRWTPLDSGTDRSVENGANPSVLSGSVSE